MKIPKGATHKIINEAGKLNYYLNSKYGEILGQDGEKKSTGERFVGEAGIGYIERTFNWKVKRIKPQQLENK